MTVERGLTGKDHLALLAVLLAQDLQGTTGKGAWRSKWTTGKGKKAGRGLSAPGLGKLGHCRADVPRSDPGRSHSVNLGMEQDREQGCKQSGQMGPDQDHFPGLLKGHELKTKKRSLGSEHETWD